MKSNCRSDLEHTITLSRSPKLAPSDPRKWKGLVPFTRRSSRLANRRDCTSRSRLQVAPRAPVSVSRMERRKVGALWLRKEPVPELWSGPELASPLGLERAWSLRLGMVWGRERRRDDRPGRRPAPETKIGSVNQFYASTKIRTKSTRWQERVEGTISFFLFEQKSCCNS